MTKKPDLDRKPGPESDMEAINSIKKSGEPKMPIVLTLAGSDPSGGAGIEGDLKTLTRLGVHAMAIPTLQTVQNTLGVREVRFLDPDFLVRQYECLCEDLFPDAIKIGAVGSKAMLHTLIRLLSRSEVRKIPIVIDTVIQSTSGADMLEPGALEDFRDGLLPLATVITPNAPEFSLLSGREVTPENRESELLRFGQSKPYATLLKGGHFPGDPVDYLHFEGTVRGFPSQRVETRHTHGTGCAFASSLAAFLSQGMSVLEATPLAQSQVLWAIQRNPGLGLGNGPLGFGN